MGNRIQKIFDVYDAASDFLAKESISVSQEQLKELMESMYSPGPSFQAIFDFPHRRFDLVSSAIKDILGYSKDQFTVEKLIENIHPSDIDHVVKSETLAGRFLFDFLDPSLMDRYKVTYQYRVKDMNDKYRSLEITIRDLKIKKDSRNMAIVSFKQDYKADNYHDYGLKKMVLVKKGNDWKIKEEEWTLLKK